MERIDAVVIGAGVVGLAVARSFATAGRSVLILERERDFGTGISSRNSEVIHAGLHYAPGSLKERLCIEGRDLLYAYCAARDVAHRRCGKLIVASEPGEIDALAAIETRARAAGVDDLQPLDRRRVQAIEPALRCEAALLSPSTGIVDARALMLSLLGEIEDHGGLLAREAAATRIERERDGWTVHAGGERIGAAIVVNAAGLGAQAVAATLKALPAVPVPPLFLARGCYFAYSGRVPFSRLIYPVPVSGGLGTHLTLDMAGGARFGPDIEWVDTIDYRVDPARKPAFVAAARRFWPDVDPDRLAPGYAGIRPKLVGPGERAADFMIQGEGEHGLPGLVNLFGIESPGLTSSLAIAERVVAMAEGKQQA